MNTEIEIARVNEQAAQRLADATGRVTYLLPLRKSKVGGHWEDAARLTTDRDEAVGWGESVAFVPQRRRTLREFGEMQERVLGEQQAGDHYDLETSDAPAARAWRKRRAEEAAAAPEPQLRVVRVLEYRGNEKWIEQTLANSWVTPIRPQHVGKGEIVEVIRTTERLCRYCGGEHLGQCSEDGCSANPAVSRHRGGK